MYKMLWDTPHGYLLGDLFMGEMDIFRQLQQHLDRQAVGFPADSGGADLRLLQRFFTAEEAQLALHLTFRLANTQEVLAQAQGAYAAERVRELLESMFSKGAIGWRQREGVDFWCLLPLVVGMYEAQDGEITREFIDTTRAYFRTPAFGRSFLSTGLSQMRTVPVSQSIHVEHPVATYDQIRAVVEGAQGPFVALKCICREGKALDGKKCEKTSRLETCLGMNDSAATVLRRKHGKEVSRAEALAILLKNEEEGLVLQPGNAQKPDFVCSCCGCCCGMLALHKMLPEPLKFWTSNYQAAVTQEKCVSCGECVKRCQVNALSLADGEGVKINRARCIGCGLCVTACATEALRLERKDVETVPPKDEEALYEEIMARKARR
jgi:Pyruvate/2-oxoacid:ferredoxin oxidoreductase delta subunit